MHRRVTPPEEIISVVDVMKVRHDQGNPQSTIKSFSQPGEIRTIECDVLIVGGGTSGVAAAVAAKKSKSLKICLTEVTDWLGGQLTAQGVPIPDEGKNFLVETSGANRSYQQFRGAVRNYYKQNYNLSRASLNKKYFNPGNCWYWVSQLTFEPKVAVQIINELLNDPENDSVPQVFLRNVPVKVVCENGEIERVLTVDLDTGVCTAFKARVYIDATELGDLLVLSGAHYNSGAESRANTQEPHAAEKPDPEHVQDYVFPFIVEFVPGTDNTIRKPRLYDHFNKQGKFSLLSYKMFAHGIKTNSDGVVVSELMPFWTYRRILDRAAFVDNRISYDASVINWYSQDFRGHNIIDKPPHVISQYLSMAKALSLGFLYWLQTEAPRDEGGKGYPEIRLKTDALGSADGLSKHPYIRESRRGKAFTIIKEQDIVSDDPSSARARLFDDSVGIGYFPIDIHGKEVAPGTLNPTKHFQVPLSAMLMKFPANVILSCKNIGTTHITNAAYRLHPIEWTIGEAAGALARFAIDQQMTLHGVLNNPKTLQLFQLDLIRSGVPLYWYDDVSTDHPYFESIQFLSVLDIMRGDGHNLHFRPDLSLNNEEAARIWSATVAKYKVFEKCLDLPASTTRSKFSSLLYDKLLEALDMESVVSLSGKII